jgi:hypothetical protein
MNTQQAASSSSVDQDAQTGAMMMYTEPSLSSEIVSAFDLASFLGRAREERVITFQGPTIEVDQTGGDGIYVKMNVPEIIWTSNGKTHRAKADMHITIGSFIASPDPSRKKIKDVIAVHKLINEKVAMSQYAIRSNKVCMKGRHNAECSSPSILDVLHDDSLLNNVCRILPTIENHFSAFFKPQWGQSRRMIQDGYVSGPIFHLSFHTNRIGAISRPISDANN